MSALSALHADSKSASARPRMFSIVKKERSPKLSNSLGKKRKGSRGEGGASPPVTPPGHPLYACYIRPTATKEFLLIHKQCAGNADGRQNTHTKLKRSTKK